MGLVVCRATASVVVPFFKDECHRIAEDLTGFFPSHIVTDIFPLSGKCIALEEARWWVQIAHAIDQVTGNVGFFLFGRLVILYAIRPSDLTELFVARVLVVLGELWWWRVWGKRRVEREREICENEPSDLELKLLMSLKSSCPAYLAASTHQHVVPVLNQKKRETRGV